MTAQELERLAVVESRIDTIDERTARIEQKLDDAIACKADKDDVIALKKDVSLKADADDFKELRRLFIGILISIAGTAIAIIVGIVLVALNLQ